MHKRKRFRSPDGIDWRDPEMPVLCNYRMQDGSLRKEVEPEYERRYREHLLHGSVEDDWRDDPTYGRR